MVPQGVGPRFRAEWTFAAFELVLFVALLGVIGVLDLGPFLPSAVLAAATLLALTVRRQRRSGDERGRDR